MSKVKWTKEQEGAINLRGQVLVSAAAGSGKTAVLVERLIRRITCSEEKVDVDRFLVVTFTKAAAAEMRERVGKALDESIFRETDPAELERLLQQRSLLYRANITTLHSFCLDLLKQYFYELELDPAFRIIDEAEGALLQQEVLEELLEEKYAQGDEEFHILVDAFSTDRDDGPLLEHILRLYEFAMSQPQPFQWLKDLSRGYYWDDLNSIVESPWGKAVISGLQDQVGEIVSLFETALRIAQEPGGPSQYLEVLQNDLERTQLLCQALKEGDWQKIEQAYAQAADFPTLPRGGGRKKGEQNKEEEERSKRLREESKSFRDEGKKKMERIGNIFALPLQEQLPLLERMGGIIGTLAQITEEFVKEYSLAKSKRNVLDFSDLEHLALKLLEKDGEITPLCEKLKEHFAEILVDEYQDINPVQEKLLQLVSREEPPNLFMVGDIKQSIYRFRMADPSLFLKKYQEFPHYVPGQEPPQPNLVIDLNQNFRSRSEIIQCINYLFYQIMTEGAGEIPYDEQAALRSGASYISDPEIKTGEGPVEVHLFDPENIVFGSPENEDRVGEENNDLLNEEFLEEQEDLETARLEARLVGARIQEIVTGEEFQVFDKNLKTYRPVQYSDIVILMRSLSSVAHLYTEEFQKMGIPVYGESNSGYFGANEIEIILSLLKTIDNPRLDIPLASVLRSPLVGLNGTELGRLRTILPQEDFYETIVIAYWAYSKESLPEKIQREINPILERHNSYLQQLEVKAQHILQETPQLGHKLAQFMPQFWNWRNLSQRVSLAEMIWQIYEDTGFLAYVGSLPAGAQRQANLQVLYDRACQFETTNYRGLFRFLRFLEKFQDQGKDFGQANILGEKDNVVRLMTIHASKGLEFPLVFVVGLGKEFNTMSLRSSLLLHSQLGAGMALLDLENRVRYPSFIQQALRERIWQESLAEELRILYVALTRARERLFLYGHVKKLEESILKWQNIANSCSSISFSDGQLRSAKSFMDWLGPAIMRHPNNLFHLDDFKSTVELPDSVSQWQCYVHQEVPQLRTELPQNLESGEDGVQEDLHESEEVLVSELTAELTRRFEWTYPYSSAVLQRAKTSVSELKRMVPWYEDGENTDRPRNFLALEFPRPLFLQKEKKLTATERGTAIHTFIQHLPIELLKEKWESLDNEEKLFFLKELRDSLILRQLLTKEQGEVIPLEKIVELVDSSTGQKLRGEMEVRREVPFTLSLHLQEQDEPVLLQGIIDCLILNHQEKEVQIIDFKTDNLQGEESPEETLISRYRVQMALYALAAQRLLKYSLGECLIYSTYLGKEIKIPRQVLHNALAGILKEGSFFA
ncbi:MAG: helicase-exonuclease AddAB subunit AddA [Desulfitobacterium sp.]|nr:helicase-exonuclease AddAB subunit AddA [Desulfitobacterium sp.]